MSVLEYRETFIPSGWRKIFYLNWAIILLIIAVVAIGFLMLLSTSGGDAERWAITHVKRFTIGLALMFCIAFTPIIWWQFSAPFIYLGGVALLLSVELFGIQAMGAKRWLEVGGMRVQPSEFMKIGMILMLSTLYSWTNSYRRSHVFWVIITILLVIVPILLILKQPDLGTALLVLLLSGAIVFAAGVHWGYFAFIFICAIMGLMAIFYSQETDFQLLKDYQYQRIEIFLNPEQDPLGAGYHITQSKIALGSGGWAGRGFMQGTQNQLNFLPEKHTDFIFTTLAEEFGFIGAIALIGLYSAILIFGTIAAIMTQDLFSRLLIIGICMNFFLYFATNMAMVIGLIPVVGVPLPLISYGGSALLVIMIGFGLLQSAYVHRVRYQ